MCQNIAIKNKITQFQHANYFKWNPMNDSRLRILSENVEHFDVCLSIFSRDSQNENNWIGFR